MVQLLSLAWHLASDVNRMKLLSIIQKLMATDFTGIIREVMCHPIFRPLGRLTYCAFLVHPAIIRIYLGNQRQPIYSSDMRLVIDFGFWFQIICDFFLLKQILIEQVTNTMSLLLQSYIVAVVLCISIEFPISALQRNFFGKENG